MALELDIVGADILRPDGLTQDRLSIADGMIVDERVGRDVDLSGYQVLPGIIDLHGDAFEKHVAPRRGAMKDVGEGLRAAERELAANGVTTGYLAQFLSWEGGLRGPDFAEKVLTALRDTKDALVTDLRGQLRLEMHMLDEFATIPERLQAWGVEYVVFNDHLPHEKLAQGKKPPRLNGQALRAGRSPERHLEEMQRLFGMRDEVPDRVRALCQTLARSGVVFGSHDDTTAANRADWRERGARISEFPETADAAEGAHANGDFVVLGAPNVVRGGSHKGNASAIDLVAMGYCDALASDYHYPSLRRAALLLEQSGLLPLAQAWALVSSGPAKVLDLADRGELLAGLRADLIVLDEHRRIVATLSAGRVSHMSGDVAERFVGA